MIAILTLGSLFSGSGGFELAGVIAGIDPLWSSEIEPYPLKVTAARFPLVKQLGDVRNISGAEIEPVDIITFGSPCQDLSVAGKQKGLAGERSGLYVETVRIIREMKEATKGEFPKWLVFENVPGLLSSNGGADFIAAMDMLQEAGFIPDPNILDAQNMGVPQRRKRVYIAWLNVDYMMRRKMNLSKIITLQLLTELLQIILVGLLRALENAPKELDALPRKLSEDGARKRMKLFSLQKVEVLQTLQENLDEIQAIYQNGRENWDSQAGNDQMGQITLMDMVMKSNGLITELPSGYIVGLLKNVLDDLSMIEKSSTISTLTKETIGLKISTCFQTLANIQNVIGVYLAWLEKMNLMYLNNCEWVQSYLTEMRVCINAAVKYEKGVRRMGWHDNVRLCERTLDALEKYVERHPGAERRQEVLPVSEGLRGDSSKSRAARKGIAAGAERSASGGGGSGITSQLSVFDARGNGDGETVPTLTGDHQNRITDYTAICVGNGQMNQMYMDDKTGTLNCMHDQQAVITPGNIDRKYILRRLTPLECCRLQGFPDWWENDVSGSDSARYKMWGNGIALPCAHDVLRRIAKSAANEE